MKKLIILFVILVSLASCDKPKTIITKEQYIENLNSFDSTAIYYKMSGHYNYITFVINYHDSLFIYDVEDSRTIRDIYITTDNGGCVK